jgi:hypothetical protein
MQTRMGELVRPQTHSPSASPVARCRRRRLAAVMGGGTLAVLVALMVALLVAPSATAQTTRPGGPWTQENQNAD